MATFKQYAITESGRILKSHVDVGATFVPTRIVLGSGYIPVGKEAKTMTAVVAQVKSLDINKKERTPDGKVIIGGMYTNEDITSDFYFRELALYAKAVYEDGTEVDEVLYAYGNAEDTAEYMAAYSTSTAVERQMDIVTYIGSDAVVNLEIASGIYTPLIDFVSHAHRHAIGGEDALTPEDIGAADLVHFHSPEEIGAAPASHSHSLESLGAAAANHSHTPESIGASPQGHTHTASEVGAAPSEHNHDGRYYTESETNALLDERAPFPTWGTEDIEAGSASSSPTGTIHYVIE